MQLAEMKAVMVEKWMQSEVKWLSRTWHSKRVKSYVSQKQKLKGSQKRSANWENEDTVSDPESDKVSEGGNTSTFCAGKLEAEYASLIHGREVWFLWTMWLLCSPSCWDWVAASSLSLFLSTLTRKSLPLQERNGIIWDKQACLVWSC